MPSTWRQVPLSQLIVALESGSRPKGGAIDEPGGTPSVGGEHITTEGGFDFSKLRYIPDDHFDLMNQGRIQLDDILIVKDGATTGKTALVEERFPFTRAAVNEHVFIVRSKSEIVLPAYLFHFLYSDWGQAELTPFLRTPRTGT